jgi:FkbM family methyltransferase
VTLGQILDLLYPDVADRKALVEAAEDVLGGGASITLSNLRRLLGGLDRQRFPSPVQIRMTAQEISKMELPGGTIYLDHADSSVSAAVMRGTYEPHVSAIIETFCAPGMTVLDVGANVGFHALAMARLVGSSGRVLAFEPNSENCRLILATLRANAITNVELLPVALGDGRGWSYFTGHVGSNGGIIRPSDGHYVEGAGSVVPLWPLDELGLETVDLIKLDVEGAEGLVLRGGERTLCRSRPVIVTELSCEMLVRVSAMDPLHYLSWWGDLGYRIHVIERSTPGGLSPAVSPQQLLDSWEGPFAIQDLLLDPTAA